MSESQATPEAHDDELQLSPSETLAHNSAMRVAGAGRGGDPAARTQRALASIVLGFELFVIFLLGLTVYGLALLTPAALGIWGGLALCAVVLVALATMRIGKLGIILGWVCHALLLLCGIILPMSLIVSVIFTALWVYCMVRGAKIDRDRAAWIAAQA